MAKADRQAHLHFIQRNLPLLATMAWDGYVKQGRGAIFIDGARAIEDPVWEGGLTPGLYVTKRMLKHAGFPEWPDPDIARMVREYEPTREVVVAILSEDGDADYYRFGTPGNEPPKAHQQHKHLLGEMALRPGELERWAGRSKK